MPPFARASELDRLFSCTGSLFLPRVQDPPGTAAQWGTLVHSWLETGEIPTQEPFRRALTRRLKESGVDREIWWPSEGVHEATFGLNLVSGEVVRCVMPRLVQMGETQKSYSDRWKESLSDEWVVGTLDFGMELLDRPWVDDLKTGRFASWHDYAAQQTFYCVVWSQYLYAELRESRSTITHWPKYPSAGKPKRKGTLLGVDTLKKFVLELTQLRESVLGLRNTGKTGELLPGDQCRYCPSRTNCPTQR